MKFTIKTIGCKVNTYESNKIKTELMSFGLIYIDVEDKNSYKDLDFYIINTCSVTSIADKKSRQMIHQAKKINDKVRVIATGCYVNSCFINRNNATGKIKYIVNDKILNKEKLEEKNNLDCDIDFYVLNRDKKNFVKLLFKKYNIEVDENNSVKDENNLEKGILLDANICKTIKDNDNKNQKQININKNILKKEYSEVIIDSKLLSKKESKIDDKKNEICGSVKNEKNFDCKVREFIKIQDGCNQYCTYCIIPYLRGNIESRRDEEIINEITEKVKNGTKEIVLTGIHISSFGLDRVNRTYESDGALDISRKYLNILIEKIASINVENEKINKPINDSEIEKLIKNTNCEKRKFGEVQRIRLGSLEPRIINEEFLMALCSGRVGEKFCANFCLSLQSGCDKTLKNMNRHYTTSDFKKACDLIRKYMPQATITADIIVGFPGETKEDFEESLEFVKNIRFYNPNIFPYSRRQGTKADTYENQISNAEKHNRAIKMIEECEKITKEIENSYDYTKHQILVEETFEIEGKKYGVGYTKEYIKGRVELK